MKKHNCHKWFSEGVQCLTCAQHLLKHKIENLSDLQAISQKNNATIVELEEKYAKLTDINKELVNKANRRIISMRLFKENEDLRNEIKELKLELQERKGIV